MVTRLAEPRIGLVHVLQLDAQVFGDELAGGQDGDVFHHGLAAVAEAGSLDGDDVDGAAQLVDDQGRQRFAVHVLGDDQQGLALADDLFQHGQEVLDAGDLLLEEQDERLVQHGFQPLGVGDEVGGDVALVELHPFDQFQRGLRALALFDGDDAVFADLVHRVGDQVADQRCSWRSWWRPG